MKTQSFKLVGAIAAIALAMSVNQVHAIYIGAGPYTPDASTVFLYHLDTATVGGTTLDASANGITANVNAGGLSTAAGVFSNGISSVAADPHGYIGSSLNSTQASSLNSGFTFSMWFNASSASNPGLGNYAYFAGFDSINNGGYLFYLRAQGLYDPTYANSITFGLLSPGYVDSAISSNFALIYDDNWHQLGATYDGTTMKLYLDNSLIASGAGPSGATFAAGGFATAGNAPWAPGAAAGAFVGSVDEISLNSAVWTDFTPVPEPSSLGLIGLALAGLTLFSRRRKAKLWFAETKARQ